MLGCGGTTCEELPVSSPNLRGLRSTTQSRRATIKEHYTLARMESGRVEYWGRGRFWLSTPGAIQVKQPGDVHRDIALDGPNTFAVIVLSTDDVERVRSNGKVIEHPHLEAGDERAAPFHRLFDAVDAGADRFSLEVALAEAIDAFATLRSGSPHPTRPVRRAMEYLRARLDESITLDDLATFADLDKFHLCRAFRAQIGMPPHAYLTNLRIVRAKELLERGIRASEVAPLVGLYDQAQLTRHFRRIVGTTPARYAKMQPRPSLTT